MTRLVALLPQARLDWQNGQQRAKRAGVPKRDVETHRCKKIFYLCVINAAVKQTGL